MYRTYEVTLTISEERKYLVDANSPEEAETVAEANWQDGDDGQLIDAHVDLTEVVPVDVEADGSVVEDPEDYD